MCSIEKIGEGNKFRLIICEEHFEELQDLKESLGLERDKYVGDK